MDRIIGRIKNTPKASVHVADGRTVIITGDVACVQRPNGTYYAVHIPTACVAFAKPVLGKA